MAKNQDKINEGYGLMESSASKYKKGDLKGAEKDRIAAYRIFESLRIAEENERKKLDSLYGESRNFGLVYAVIEENLSTMMQTKKGKLALGKIGRTIRNTPELKRQSQIYEALTTFCPEDISEKYVDEVMRKAGKSDRKSMTEANDRLIKLIQESGMDEMVDINDEHYTLFEAIETALHTNGRLSRFVDFVQAKKTIAESLCKLPQPKVKDNGKSYDELIESITKADLTDDEMRLVIEMKQAPDKEALFIKYKEKALGAISEQASTQKEEDKRNYLNHVYSRVEEMEYSPETVYEMVANIAEVISIIEE